MINRLTAIYILLCTDMKICLESLAGKEEDTLVTLTIEPTEFNGTISCSVTRGNLRRLRVEWMYHSNAFGFLLLDDEVG